MAITFLTVSIHLKYVLPQCCDNKVSYSLSTHISPCYHSAVAITFLTVSIHLKYVLPQCCDNRVSYTFSTHRSPCYHSDVAITFLTVFIHLKSVLPQCCDNKVSYSFSTHISPCYHTYSPCYSFVSIKLIAHLHIQVTATTVQSQQGFSFPPSSKIYFLGLQDYPIHGLFTILRVFFNFFTSRDGYL